MADANLTVTITGPSALNKAQAGTYTVTATKVGVNGAKMGIDVASSDAASLSVVFQQPTVLNSGEIVHNNTVFDIVAIVTPILLRSIAGNTANYQFTYTMPADAVAGSAHTLYAVSAVGFAGGWNNAPNFSVLTRPVAPTSVTASNVAGTSVNLNWIGTGPEYRVVYKAGAVAPANETDGTASDHGTSTSATISGLLSLTQYSFAVFSKLAGQSVFSTTAATTTATTVTAPRYVNANTGTNTGNCANAGSPCKTITYAMAQAGTGNPGDPINVAPGTYNVALGEVFPIAMKSGVQLQATGTAANTIVDATGANARVFNATGSNASTVIQGFTITGGFHQPAADGSNAQGGAIFIDNLAQIKVRRNILTGNEARGYGGVAPSSPTGGEAYGGAIVSSNASPTIENNVFSANTAQGGDGVDKFDGTAGGDAGSAHGGALFVGGGSAVIVNNTFRGNMARGGPGGSSNATSGGAGGLAFNGAVESNNASVVNNIFASNSAVGGAGGGGSPAGSTGNSFNGALNANVGPSTTHNLFFGNTAAINIDTLGTNSVLLDPLFHSAPLNLHIRLASPAKAAGATAGAPALDFDATTRPSPPSIGAFEASALASTTALTSSVNPSTVGQAVTFTATVSGSGGTATGTAAFKDGAATLCASVTLASGQAQCATSSLSQGTHSITAEYSGSATYAASTSPALSQVVQGPSTFTLTVSKTGSGTGTVTSSPAGINCGATCAASFNSGSAVTLTAAASTGSTFGGWSGGGCSGTGGCTVTLSAATTVTATFNVTPAGTFALTVSKTGSGTGTVTSSPAGINCGSTCTADFTSGASVTLTAAASSGSTFGGWSGGGCSGTSGCTVTLSAATTVTATFNVTPAGTFALAVTKTGTGAGTVTSSPAGIACGSTCAADFTSGASVTLTAAASTGSTFGGWSGGGCSGTGTCMVTLGSAIGVTATFVSNPPRLGNISTRMQVLTGNDVMIGGFVIGGSVNKTVAIVATGPSLAAFGIANPLANPTLTLVRSSDQTVIATNDNWQSASNAAAISASGFAPTNSLESAILITLDPGAYTAIVSGVGGGTGVGVIAVYTTP